MERKEKIVAGTCKKVVAVSRFCSIDLKLVFPVIDAWGENDFYF